jgi:hypothetical protein
VKAAPTMAPDSAGAMLSNLLETLDTPRGRSLLGFVLEKACQESVRTFVEAAVAAGGENAELNALPLAMLDKVCRVSIECVCVCVWARARVEGGRERSLAGELELVKIQTGPGKEKRGPN